MAIVTLTLQVTPTHCQLFPLSQTIERTAVLSYVKSDILNRLTCFCNFSGLLSIKSTISFFTKIKRRNGVYYLWYHESTFGFHFFFFFLDVEISDSVQWLPYLGFVPGPTRTTSKGLMSLLFMNLVRHTWRSSFDLESNLSSYSRQIESKVRLRSILI